MSPRITLAIPPGLRTQGDLGAWLDQKPPALLLDYLLFGQGSTEKLACFDALVRRELRHQRDHHTDPTGDDLFPRTK